MPPETVDAPPAAKARLRGEALARRAAVPPAVRAALAARLARDGLALAASHAGAPAVVSAFHPLRDEPDTMPLLAALARAGYETALPVAGRRAAPLAFRAWRPGAPLVAARFGLAEPPAAAAARVPRILFVPLAAHDRAGHRIGYGGGFYDATLAALRAGGPVLAIGTGFACQAVARIPAEPHDAPLDALITEDGVLDFRT